MASLHLFNKRKQNTLTAGCLKAHILFQKITSSGKVASFFGGSECLEFSRESRLTRTQPESGQHLTTVILNPDCVGQSENHIYAQYMCSTAEQILHQNFCEVISLVSVFAHI